VVGGLFRTLVRENTNKKFASGVMKRGGCWKLKEKPSLLKRGVVGRSGTEKMRSNAISLWGRPWGGGLSRISNLSATHLLEATAELWKKK